MHTHVNFQRVPMVDTSNPFIARDIPSPDESMVMGPGVLQLLLRLS